VGAKNDARARTDERTYTPGANAGRPASDDCDFVVVAHYVPLAISYQLSAFSKNSDISGFIELMADG
jgi:hypothetical protein